MDPARAKSLFEISLRISNTVPCIHVKNNKDNLSMSAVHHEHNHTTFLLFILAETRHHLLAAYTLPAYH